MLRTYSSSSSEGEVPPTRMKFPFLQGKREMRFDALLGRKAAVEEPDAEWTPPSNTAIPPAPRRSLRLKRPNIIPQMNAATASGETTTLMSAASVACPNLSSTTTTEKSGIVIITMHESHLLTIE